MTTRLMNSAMMPAEGVYTLKELGMREFADKVSQADAFGELKSYIGYPQTADMIAAMSGVPIDVCRDETSIDDGDVLLIARLAYRVADPKTKGQPVPEHFKFYSAEYRSLP